jgi:hypothetical protein
MKYTTIYDKITNPLDNPQVLEQLIEAYSEGSSFYSALTNRFSKNKKLLYSKQARDELHSSIFNRWKKELLSITTEQYKQAIKDKLYKPNIFKLISFLRTVPDVKTEKEANDILNKTYQDKELEEAIEEYRWDSIGAFSGWTHISERYINGKKTITPKIEHRLYINTDLMDVHNMSKIFMDKCHAKKLPFYFKIGECDRRDDNIVIYSDTKLLPHYLGILKEIEDEYPDLVRRCGKPPVLSGVIRNWIGYGSEPIQLSGKESFNGIRSKSIEKSIDEELIEWYRNHKNTTITTQGQTISLQEYLVRQVVKNKIKKMIDYKRRNPNNKYIKYTETEIQSKEFAIKMANLVRTQMPSIFNDYINGKKTSVKIEVPIKQDVNATLYSSDIVAEFKRFISIIKSNDSDFIKRVKQRILADAINNGIDPNKYCFDIANVELLRRMDDEQAKSRTVRQEQQAKQKSEKPVENRETKQKDTTGSRENYHRPAETRTPYKPMTDEEIRESQRKLAECSPVQGNSFQKTKTPVYDKPKYHRPAGTPTSYKPMTDEEIRESQRKLAEVPMAKVKVKIKKVTQ